MKRTLLLTFLIFLLAFPAAVLAEETSLQDDAVNEEDVNQEDVITEEDIVSEDDVVNEDEATNEELEEIIEEATEEQAEKPTGFSRFWTAVQQWFEHLKVVTFDRDEAKFDQYLEEAEAILEELAEASQDVDEDILLSFISAFADNVSEASNILVKLAEKDADIDELMERLEAVILEGEELMARFEEIVIELPEEDNEKLDTAKVTPAVVAHIDSETISELRGEGFGYGQIALLVAMSEQAEVDLDEVKELHAELKGIGRVAKELGLHPGQLRGKAPHTRDKDEPTDEDVIEEDAVEEDNDGTEDEEASINSQQSKQSPAVNRGNGNGNGNGQQNGQVRGNGNNKNEVKGNQNRGNGNNGNRGNENGNGGNGNGNKGNNGNGKGNSGR